MTDIDTNRLWEKLGEMSAAMKTAAAQREEMMADIKALRAEQIRQRQDHDKLVNRGYGVLLGVGTAAGGVGAAVKSMFFSGG